MQIGLGIQRQFGSSLGLRLPNLSELIGYYKGLSTVIDFQTYQKSSAPSGSSAIAQAKGVSVRGDGTGFGTITGLLTTDIITVGTGSGAATCTVNGRLDIANGVDAWGVQIHRGTVLFADLNMMCGTDTVHPDIELSATPGLPNCTWASFAAGIYVEHTNGDGFDLNVKGWTVADGTTMYLEASHTNLLLADSRIPPGAGFDASGDPLVTQNVGPIAANMRVVGVPCLLGDGTGYASITGLLTTDVITVPTGSSQPTNTINGRMDFVNTEKPFHITVTRSSTVWAFYPCEAGEGIVLEDTINANNGTLTNFATPWSTRDVGESLMIEFGFSIDRAIEPDSFIAIGATGSSLTETEIANGWNIVNDGIGLNESANWIGLDVSAIYPGGSIRIDFDGVINSGSYTITHYFDGVLYQVNPYGPYLITDGKNSVLIPSRSSGVLRQSISTNIQQACDIDMTNISVKQVVTGVSCCNDTYLHQDGTAPTYPRNTMSNTLNAPVLHEGALGLLTQAIALWTAEAQVDIPALPANTADQTLVGDNGMVIYDTAQSADDIAKAVRVIGELT